MRTSLKEMLLNVADGPIEWIVIDPDWHLLAWDDAKTDVILRHII